MNRAFIQYAGAVFDNKEIDAATKSLKEGWLGVAKSAIELERQLANLFEVNYGVVVNSGSSANLLALTALKIQHNWPDGSEIITALAGFPTTLNPIIQNRLIPVFIDVNYGDYNINTEYLEKALSDKTVALFLAHTLANPFNVDKIVDFCKIHNLKLIEDCCDALGSKWADKHVGSFGDACTLSMYPAHHITAMGEGGFIGTSDKKVHSILRSLRDWGRACWCTGSESMNKEGVCRNRFSNWLGGEEIVDHKYIYNYVGYNLKPVEAQCAFALEQLKKFPGFVKKRKHNFNKLYSIFEKYQDYFILPKWDIVSDVSWFAFPLTVKKDCGITKNDFCQFLETNKIQTRPLFAGSLLKHPAYKKIEHRIVGDTSVADHVTFNTFFIGVYPGITDEMIVYIEKVVKEFFDANRK